MKQQSPRHPSALRLDNVQAGQEVVVFYRDQRRSEIRIDSYGWVLKAATLEVGTTKSHALRVTLLEYCYPATRQLRKATDLGLLPHANGKWSNYFTVRAQNAHKVLGCTPTEAREQIAEFFEVAEWLYREEVREV